MDDIPFVQFKVGLDVAVGEAEEVDDPQAGVGIDAGIGVVRQDEVGVAVLTGGHGLAGGHSLILLQGGGVPVGAEQRDGTVDGGHAGGQRFGHQP